MWATLGQGLVCSDADGDDIITFDECSWTDQEIGLLLETKAVHFPDQLGDAQEHAENQSRQ